MAVMKPDIVFFGEELPHEFHSQLQEDMEQADLLIVMGSSLKVRPVALVPNLIDPKIPQILINKESLGKFNFDVELLGNSDDIVEELCYRLGEDWVKDVSFSKPCSSQEFTFVAPNRYLFKGAEYHPGDNVEVVNSIEKNCDKAFRCVSKPLAREKEDLDSSRDSKRPVVRDGECSYCSDPKRLKP
jgi:NAD-dependent deacetylase sirtuin 1